MNDEGREAALGFGRGRKGDDTGDRCSQMNGDSPCNQGREAVWSRELQAKAPRHGGGLGVPEAEERTWNCVRRKGWGHSWESKTRCKYGDLGTGPPHPTVCYEVAVSD